MILTEVGNRGGTVVTRLGRGAPRDRVRRRTRQLLGVLVFSVLIAAGCWRPAPPPETPPAPPPEAAGKADGLAQEKIALPEIKEIAKPKEKPVPKSEQPERAAEKSGAASSTPVASASTRKPALAKDESQRITSEQLASISVGMSLDDVQKAMGLEAQTISSNNVSSAILKWTDDTGRSLVAKFEDGELVRKSSFVPAGGSAEEKTADGPKITQELYDGIASGMALEDIDSLLGLTGRRIAEGRENIVIYKWVDDTGSNFTAKFENGALVHKTGFYVSPLKEETAAASLGAEDTGEPEPEAEVAAVRGLPPESDGAQPAHVEPPAAEPAVTPPSRPQVTSVKPQRVRVAGTTRREREAANRDPDQPMGAYKPKAKLPDYTWSLRRGSYEVRVHNSTGSRVRVGLRSGQGGKDITISSGGTQSFRVDRASYDLFYVFDDSPYKLHRSSGIVLDGFYYGDIEIMLFNENSDIRAIDYANE